ncbi:methyl jasmonate esterase 1-like [Rutidosis leptorrhynchoides]|uniref:methyl jasmonate esterase 1-like n=1 Tax=Rutidosis leptorrhynchoides TaxID=125765 RepID=UPI003A98F0E9
MEEKHFVLVHGASHGAWCWYKVASILKSAGHRVSALDMASCGVNPTPVREIHSLSDYFQPLTEFLEALPPQEKVILVGHSYGGRGLAIAMEKFPHKISVAVFASAHMPGPHFKLSTYAEAYDRIRPTMDTKFEYADGSDNPPMILLFGPKILSSKFYQLSPPEDLMLATMLLGPHPCLNDPAMLDSTVAVTEEKFGSVRRISIVCDQDLVIEEHFQRWVIQQNPVDEEFVIPGSDHMVMFSKPQELSSILQEIAQKYE